VVINLKCRHFQHQLFFHDLKHRIQEDDQHEELLFHFYRQQKILIGLHLFHFPEPVFYHSQPGDHMPARLLHIFIDNRKF